MRNTITLAAAALVLSGCTDQPALYPGSDEGAPRMTLPAGEIAVYEQDSITVDVGGDGAARAQLLLLDGAGAVVWRSEEAPVAGTAVRVPISGVGREVPRGEVLRVTGVLSTPGGERFYASDDTTAVRTLAHAATRQIRVYAGQRVSAWPSPAVAADFIAAPDLGVAFFASPAEALIGVLDLSHEASELRPGAVATAPSRLAYAPGMLAAMSADGGEVAFLRASEAGLQQVRRALLAPLEIEVDTTFLAAVRPAGRTLALGCVPGCEAPVAVVPSGLVTLKGAAGAVPGVVRLLPAVDSASPPRLVVPGHDTAVRDDSAVVVSVFTPAAPDGARQQLQRRAGASRCLSTWLPDAVALAADGRLYAASGTTSPACGPGTSLVRIDSVLSGAPKVSGLGVRNTLAEARIGRVAELQLSDDGTRLLIRSDSIIAIADADLRVLGTVPAAGATAAAWLRGAAAPPRIAVADSAGVTVYGTDRMTRMVHIPIGRTAGPVVFLHRSGGDVVAAAIAGGFVVARVPEP